MIWIIGISVGVGFTIGCAYSIFRTRKLLRALTDELQRSADELNKAVHKGE